MAGPWELYQDTGSQKSESPAGSGPWQQFADRSDRPPATTTEAQERKDRELVEAASGIVPEAVKTGAYNALNAAGFNIPSHIAAAATKVATGRPYEEVYKEQKEYEEALARRNPIASKVGTGAGIVGGMFVPLGAVGRAGQIAKAAVTPKLGVGAGKAAEYAGAGATGAGLSGLSTGIETLDVGEAGKSALVGAGLGVGLQAAMGPLSKAFGKVKSPVDPDTGAPTDEAKLAINRALSPYLPADEIAKVQDGIIANMAKKGATEEAAIEGFLASQGVKPSKAMVTGVQPAKAAEDIAQEAQTVAQETLAKRATEKFPTGPIETSVADDLLKGANTLKGKASAEFDAARNLEVEFAEHVQQSLFPMLQLKLEGNMPVGGKIQRFPTLAEGAEADRFPQASKAYEYIKGLSSGDVKLPFSNDPLNAENVIEIGKKLNAFRSGASAEDRRVLDFIRHSYKDSIGSAVESGLYTGAGRELLDKWQSGNKLWNQFSAMYNPRRGRGSEIMNKITGRMVDDQGNLTSNLAQDAAEAAQGAINSGLMNRELGTAVYSRLEKVLGKDSEAMKTIKSNMRTLALGDTSDLTQLPKKIDGFLTNNANIAKRIFTPQELSEMRQLSAAIKLVNKAPTTARERESDIINILQRGTSIGAGIIGNNFHGFPGAIIGAGLAEAGGAGIRAVASGLQRGAERAGAPKLKEAPQILQNAPIRNLEAFESVETGPEYQALPLRPGRATGGRIAHPESIANSLVSMADKAKKTINNNTEVLLKTPDTHVAQALEIANRQIEG
jgi:hypothetical protein